MHTKLCLVYSLASRAITKSLRDTLISGIFNSSAANLQTSWIQARPFSTIQRTAKRDLFEYTSGRWMYVVG